MVVPPDSRIDISRIVADLGARYLAEGRAASLQQINAGSCEDFAMDLIELLEEFPSCDSAEDVCIAGFLAVDPSTGFSMEGGPFDRELIERLWPDMVPPEGLSWDDLDRLSGDVHFNGGTHIWTALNGRHYDAESPNGVASPFELPFFKRVIASWVAEFGIAPSP